MRLKLLCCRQSGSGDDMTTGVGRSSSLSVGGHTQIAINKYNVKTYGGDTKHAANASWAVFVVYVMLWMWLSFRWWLFKLDVRVCRDQSLTESRLKSHPLLSQHPELQNCSMIRANICHWDRISKQETDNSPRSHVLYPTKLSNGKEKTMQHSRRRIPATHQWHRI